MAWTSDDRAAAELATDLFSGLGEIEVRRMFGGAGLYLHDAIFAIVYQGEIYLKTDSETAAWFEEAGAHQFEWVQPKTGRPVKMRYWTIPEPALDDPELACEWARMALRPPSNPM